MRTKEISALYLPAPRLNQLNILKEIGSDSDITQAELARRCSLSVAMVNNYMKELCAKGFLEYHRKSSKSISYHLTVTGKQSADIMQQSLLEEHTRLFKDAMAQIRDAILRFCSRDIERIALYGCGDLAELALLALESAKLKVIGVFDDHPARIGSEWCGLLILDASQLRFMEPDAVVIAKCERTEEPASDLSVLCGGNARIINLNMCSSYMGSGNESSAIQNSLPNGMCLQGTVPETAEVHPADLISSTK